MHFLPEQPQAFASGAAALPLVTVEPRRGPIDGAEPRDEPDAAALAAEPGIAWCTSRWLTTSNPHESRVFPGPTSGPAVTLTESSAAQAMTNLVMVAPAAAEDAGRRLRELEEPDFGKHSARISTSKRKAPGPVSSAASDPGGGAAPSSRPGSSMPRSTRHGRTTTAVSAVPMPDTTPVALSTPTDVPKHAIRSAILGVGPGLRCRKPGHLTPTVHVGAASFSLHGSRSAPMA